MGWTYTHKPDGVSVVDFLKQNGELTWKSRHNYTVLGTAVVKLRTLYAAVERVDADTGKRDVFALVFLLDYRRAGHNFGWKDMDETMGPCEATCPDKILDLLTPTDNENANDWRRRCRAYNERRRDLKRLKPGTVLAYAGQQYQILSSLPRGAKSVVRVSDGVHFHMRPSQVLESTIVPDDPPECPACGGECTTLGALGARKHYRCRQCGVDYARGS